MFPVLGPVLSLEAQVQKGVPSPIRPDEDVSALASIASVRPCFWLALQPQEAFAAISPFARFNEDFDFVDESHGV
jgi:hypothetical protein